MNEQDLRERLELGIEADLGAPAIDPAADITRGRKRLRRIRVATGFAAATSVAAVAALGLQFLPAGSSQLPAPAAQPTPTPSLLIPKDLAQQGSTANLSTIVYGHVDPARVYTARPAGWTLVQDVKSGSIQEMSLAQAWNQEAGPAQLHVSISDPVRAEPKSWCDGLAFKEPVKVICSPGRTTDDRPIITGQVKTGAGFHDDGGQFVQYLRPDGQLVVAALLRLNENISLGGGNGIAPAVTLEQLQALATDPGLTLPTK